MKVDEEITDTLCLPELNARQLYLFTGLNAHEISVRFGYSLEVARRLSASLVLGKLATDSRVELLPSVKNGDDVADYVRTIIGTHNTEVFYALYLNANGRILHQQEISHGSLSASLVHPREVLVPGVTHRAAAFIVAHNHPSGVAEPSQADVAITRRLKEALDTIDVRVLDHLIIGHSQVVSLAERGQI